MQDDKPINFQDLDQVLFDAQHRRSIDIGLWLKLYLGGRREARRRRESLLDATTTLQRPAA